MIQLTLLHNSYCYDSSRCKFFMDSSASKDFTNEILEPYDIVCEMMNYQLDISRRMCGIILKLTNLCNMSCSYCPHSQKDNLLMKVHSNSVMPEKIALQGIDYLSQHSTDCDTVDIVFFGGEPLTAFSLMKRIVCYAEEVLKEKQIL